MIFLPTNLTYLKVRPVLVATSNPRLRLRFAVFRCLPRVRSLLMVGAHIVKNASRSILQRLHSIRHLPRSDHWVHAIRPGHLLRRR